MKLIKKLAASALALIMGCLASVLSACDNGNFEGIFPSTGGDTTNNGTGDEDVVGEVLGDKEAFFASLAVRPSAAAIFQTEIGYSTTKSIYAGSSSVTKTVVSSTTDDIFAVGAADLTNGDIDLAITDGRTEVSGTVSDSENFVSYFFRRDGHDFISRNVGAQISEDYSGLTLTYGGETEFEDEIAEIFSILPAFGAGVPTNYVIAKLADITGALKVGKDSATIDVNAVLYNTATDLHGVLRGVSENTTLEALLQNATVKKYISPFTELIPVEDAASFIANLKYADLLFLTADDKYLASIGLTRELFDKIADRFFGVDFGLLSKIEPDDESTTYDYILKLIKSEELRDVLNAAFFPVAEESEKLPKISDLTISECMVLAGIAEDEVSGKFAYAKNYADAFISDSFTPTAFTYTKRPTSPLVRDYKSEKPEAGGPTEKYTLSDAVIEFDLTEDGAAGTEHISFLLLKSETEGAGAEVTLTEQSLAVAAAIDFSEAVSLADVGDCTAEYTAITVKDAVAEAAIKRAALDGGVGIAPVVLRTSVDLDGNLSGVYVCDLNGNIISNDGEFDIGFSGGDGEEKFTLSYTYSQYEESGDVKVTFLYGGKAVGSAIIWSTQYTFTSTVSSLISKQ